jgi:MSHA biogenesis protein MshO
VNHRGFTLLELVVALTIASIVGVFATMFMRAPIDAYEAHSRRAQLVNDTAAAWPRIETDLQSALPNSVRARRNGNIVVLEMLAVVDVARYKTPASAASITTAGTFRGIPMPLPFVTTRHYLFVNSNVTPGADPFSLAGAMTPAGTQITIAAGGPGEQVVTLNITPSFPTDSPRHRIYLLSGPVTYLCDEALGTLRRYSNYSMAANQAARDTAAELNGAGATAVLVAQGLTTCNFDATPPGSTTQSQTAAVRLTTTRSGDSITLLHSARSGYVP